MATRIPAYLKNKIDALEPIIRQAFLDAVADMQSNAQFALVVDALERGDMAALYRALNIDPAFLAPLDQAILAAHYQGGVAALAGLPVIIDPVGPGKSLAALRAAILGRRNG